MCGRCLSIIRIEPDVVREDSQNSCEYQWPDLSVLSPYMNTSKKLNGMLV